MRHSGVTVIHTGDLYQPSSNASETPGRTQAEPSQKRGDLIPLNYETVSDEVLVELYNNKRDETALTSIIRRYKDTIFGFAMKMTKNHSDAEDIVQEISFTLVNKLSTFKGNSKFSTWLYKVTLNTCYMVLNKKNKTTQHEVNSDYLYELAPASQASFGKWTKSPATISLYRERAELIQNAVNELSEHNREIIRLKDIEGYSNAEVGEIMGISISAVKSRLLRSRLVLRKKLVRYFPENI